MYHIQRSDREIDEVMNLAAKGIDEGTQWPGQTYEEGVKAALAWVFGDNDDNPMKDE